MMLVRKECPITLSIVLCANNSKTWKTNRNNRRGHKRYWSLHKLTSWVSVSSGVKRKQKEMKSTSIPSSARTTHYCSQSAGLQCAAWRHLTAMARFCVFMPVVQDVAAAMLWAKDSGGYSQTLWPWWLSFESLRSEEEWEGMEVMDEKWMGNHDGVRQLVLRSWRWRL
jgi:hypothetical protein